jgi:transposase, IS30 family
MKQRKYTHIKKAERLEIAILLKRKHSQRSIADVLGRSAGTISEEISLNSVNDVYNPLKADHKAYVKRKYSKYQGMKVAENKDSRDYVEEKLKQGWSPEQICGRIKNHDKHIMPLGVKGIYKFIYSPYGRQLERYLRYKGRKRKPRRLKVGQLKNRTFIDQRPEIIGNRERLGDWEGDFIVSGKQGKGVLAVVYERKTMYIKIRKIMSRKCDAVNKYIREMTGGFVCFNSLTIDNDISFRKHEELSRLLGAPVYFCRPYHAWEKGGVENINKLIRQYIPKGSDISKYDDEDIARIETRLNNRPRKGLNYKTPLEFMSENKQFKSLEDFGIIIKQKTPVGCSA